MMKKKVKIIVSEGKNGSAAKGAGSAGIYGGVDNNSLKAPHLPA